jgi:hypothetical protein
MPIAFTQQAVAEISLVGMGLDLLGGCYLAYDLLGGRHGPLRIIARTAGYIALFFVGYLLLIGLSYALVAASGMGTTLILEFAIAGNKPSSREVRRARLIAFGFMRGLVLGVAGMTVAGVGFGIFFGLLSGIGLTVTYLGGFAPMDDYAASQKPRLSRHKTLASLYRGVAVSTAGILAGLLSSSTSVWLGLRLGLAAGVVSALISLFSPIIEWRIENLPERRLGMIGVSLILAGVVLQSIQYWLTVFAVPVG